MSVEDEWYRRSSTASLNQWLAANPDHDQYDDVLGELRDRESDGS